MTRTRAYHLRTRAYITGKQTFVQILKQEGVSAEDDRYVAMDLDRPRIDFLGPARSLGVAGTRVDKASDIGPAVSRALASGAPHLVHVRIDPSFV
ncbi:MAG TPA: thiamine pyrophosphate-dependent enzyme [Methylomirabilota bacterium]